MNLNQYIGAIHNLMKLCNIQRSLNICSQLRLQFLFMATGLMLGLASGWVEASPAEIKIITTEASGGCLLSEVIVNNVLIAHALRTRDGLLSEIDNEKFTGFAQYFPPND
ncbi:hypothetical protein [Nitrosomonas sp. Is79A3]|uniref:hypothetical protein n=1 Tax=Nitrosomonas sp. (strain Is79A3) TaxID=261292 RepID=UPI00059C2BA6